jgi:hypothetical protein
MNETYVLSHILEVFTACLAFPSTPRMALLEATQSWNPPILEEDSLEYICQWGCADGIE